MSPFGQLIFAGRLRTDQLAIWTALSVARKEGRDRKPFLRLLRPHCGDIAVLGGHVGGVAANRHTPSKNKAA